MSLQWHPHCPSHHVPRQPAGEWVHVPRVDEHCGVERGGVLQEGDDPFVVKVLGASVVADVHPHVAVLHRALQLEARVVNLVERHLAEGVQPAVRGRAHLERCIVEMARHVERRLARPVPLEEDRGRTDNLRVDSEPIEVVEPCAHVPTGVCHRSEVGVSRHEHRAAGPIIAESPCWERAHMAH